MYARLPHYCSARPGVVHYRMKPRPNVGGLGSRDIMDFLRSGGVSGGKGKQMAGNRGGSKSKQKVGNRMVKKGTVQPVEVEEEKQ